MYKQLAATAEGDLKRLMESAVHLVDHLQDVPVHVVPCVIAQAAVVGVEIPRAVLYGSIYPAVWSFQLALRGRGLGSSRVMIDPQQAVADILGIPDGCDRPVCCPSPTSSVSRSSRRRGARSARWSTWKGGAPRSRRRPPMVSDELLAAGLDDLDIADEPPEPDA